MEKIGQNMPHMNRVRQFDYQELVKQIMADPDVAAFIQQEKLTQGKGIGGGEANGKTKVGPC